MKGELKVRIEYRYKNSKQKVTPGTGKELQGKERTGAGRETPARPALPLTP